MADFETTTDAEDCRVWLWGLLTIDNPEYDAVEVGIDTESFMERIQQHNSTVYFHNLKFDIQFIMPWLFNHGFKHSTAQELTTPSTFKTLISDMGMYYSLTVRWDNGHSTEFRDSLKKIPMPVSRIAQAWKLEVTKGTIDYHAYREIGHKPTPEEEDYLRRDLVIPAKAMKEILDTGMSKLTVASDALAEYKQLTGSDHFKRLFPVLHDSIDKEIRRAYRGGFTYSDERFRGHVTRSGLTLDVNSLYPYIMHDRLLPYGEPEFVRGMVEPTMSRPLTIFSVTFTAKIKPNHIPCIQIKGSSIFSATEYLKEIKEATTMMVTNVDWDMYVKHYDIEVQAYGGGWRFHAMRGMFDTYINKWSEVKARETGGKREIAKLHLNALYGKFASNPDVTSKIPYMKDGIVKLRRGENEKRPPVYTAVGVFITSFARDLTIGAAQANYDSFAYADTDSLHLLRDDVPVEINVHPTELGAWKLEYHFDSAYYVRAKFYMEHLDDKIAAHEQAKAHGGEACPDDCTDQHSYVTRIAGLPVQVSSQLTFDDLRPDTVLHGKLTPKTVPGGVVLKDVPFALNL